jgi:glycosyltransferase involved in cell wall biosynthesis
VEALSSGLPVVATSKAFRGMGIDPSQLRNVFIADDASEFAAAMMKRRGMNERSDPMTSDTRALYEERYSSERYASRLGDIASKLMARMQAK